MILCVQILAFVVSSRQKRTLKAFVFLVPQLYGTIFVIIKMIEYDTVQYVMPQHASVLFSIAPDETSTSVTVLDGEGVLLYRDSQKEVQAYTLSLRHANKFSLFPYKLPNYDKNYTETLQGGPEIMALENKSKIAVRGNHQVQRAGTGRVFSRTVTLMVYMVMRVDSYCFSIYGELVTLKIFTGDESSRVVIRALFGSPRVMGSPLAPNEAYRLLPHSCVTVNSITEQCTLEVEGRNRMIRIALLKNNDTLNVTKKIFNRLLQLCLLSMNEICVAPVYLVIGPPNVGKTSLCHFLLNKAVDKGINLLYIDLDVRKNSNSLPGSISLLEIKSHRHITEGFEKHEQTNLHFGNLNVNSHNVLFYHYLIRKLGQQLKKYLMNKITSCSGAVIDMCGPLGQDESTISCILTSFDVNMILVVGDLSNKDFYYHIVNTFVEKETEFIPQPEDIEPVDEMFEEKSRNIIFRRYFYGDVTKPEEPDIIEIKLADVKVYRVVSNSTEDSTTLKSTVVNDDDFSLEPVTLGPLIEYLVLGVSKAADITDLSSAIEIDHFVCFTKIDLDEGLGLLLSPKPGPFSGKCLIMGNVKMTTA